MSQMMESFLTPGPTGLRAQAIALEHAEEGGAPGAPLLRDTHPLHAIKVSLQVCVGVATLSVGELLQAGQGQVLVLDRLVEQDVDLMLEGKVVARGQLVAVDGTFGIRLTELPLPLRM